LKVSTDELAHQRALPAHRFAGQNDGAALPPHDAGVDEQSAPGILSDPQRRISRLNANVGGFTTAGFLRRIPLIPISHCSFKKRNQTF